MTAARYPAEVWPCLGAGPPPWRNYRTGLMQTQDWTEEQARRAIRPAAAWRPVAEYGDIRYEVAEGIAKITIDRPEVRNAFRPETLVEISDALERAREDPEVGAIVLTGEGPDAFCSGGD